MNTSHTASCQCGALTVTCEGDPVRISVCHCLACQLRSGGPFAAQARFPVERVSFGGEDRVWRRIGDAGGVAEHHFCPTCGSTVWYAIDDQPGVVAVAIGAFADPAFPAPKFSVYERRRHAWVGLIGDSIEHHD